MDTSQQHPSRRSTLLKLLSERRQDIIPATTYGVDRYSHPWMAADPSFARLLEATDAHEHIFALHRSYYASFGATDILASAIRPRSSSARIGLRRRPTPSTCCTRRWAT